MDWEIVCVLIAFLVYWLYNIVILSKFNIPISLSETYYLFKNDKKWKRILFPLMMFLIAGFLLPSWLEISDGTGLEFMAFLSAGGMLFTGAAPSFKDSKLEDNVHTYSAYISVFFALLWVVFVANLWYIIVVWFLIFSLIALLSKTFKTSYTYWLEMLAFMATFTSIIVYYINLQ
jgi:hypothetical protein